MLPDDEKAIPIKKRYRGHQFFGPNLDNVSANELLSPPVSPNEAAGYPQAAAVQCPLSKLISMDQSSSHSNRKRNMLSRLQESMRNSPYLQDFELGAKDWKPSYKFSTHKLKLKWMRHYNWDSASTPFSDDHLNLDTSENISSHFSRTLTSAAGSNLSDSDDSCLSSCGSSSIRNNQSNRRRSSLSTTCSGYSPNRPTRVGRIRPVGKLRTSPRIANKFHEPTPAAKTSRMTRSSEKTELDNEDQRGVVPDKEVVNDSKAVILCTGTKPDTENVIEKGCSGIAAGSAATFNMDGGNLSDTAGARRKDRSCKGLRYHLGIRDSLVKPEKVPIIKAVKRKKTDVGTTQAELNDPAPSKKRGRPKKTAIPIPLLRLEKNKASSTVEYAVVTPQLKLLKTEKNSFQLAQQDKCITCGAEMEKSHGDFEFMAKRSRTPSSLLKCKKCYKAEITEAGAAVTLSQPD